MKIVTCPKCFKKMKIEEDSKLFLCPHCKEKISIEDVVAEPEVPAETEVPVESEAPAETEAPMEITYQEPAKCKNKKTIIAVAVALVAVVAGTAFFLLSGESGNKEETKEQVEDKKEDKKENKQEDKQKATNEDKKKNNSEVKKKEEKKVEILVPYYDEESDLYGYCTIEGEVKIEPQFDEAYAFEENGLARVGIEDGWSTDYGYINEKGEIIRPKN